MHKVLIVLLLLSLCYPSVASSKSLSGYKTGHTAGRTRLRGYHKYSRYVQKGAFRYKKNAERFSRRLKRKGYRVLIVRGITSGKLKVYRVLAWKKKEKKVPKASGVHKVGKVEKAAGMGPASAAERGRESKRPTAGEVSGIPDHATATVALSSGVPPEGAGPQKGVSPSGKDKVMPDAGLQGKAPVGTLKNYREMFINRKRYFHATLSVDEIYTDNAYGTQNNKKSNFSTVITPSVWVALPRVSEERVVIDQTSNRMPGGLIISKYGPENLRRFQFHLIYRPSIPSPSSNSPYGNAVSHTAHGDLIYNGNKISGGVTDTFKKSYDTRGLNIATKAGEIDRYYSNRLGASAGINTGNRLRFQFNYSNFLVHYSGKGNDFMDRTDNSYSGYLFYKLQPKTSAFVEYSLIHIAYSSDTSHDSSEHHLMAGIQWDITAKSKGRLKAGYDKKDFSNSSHSANTFIAEAQINHQLSPRTLLTLTGFRKTDESNVQTYLYAVTSQIELGCQHILTAKTTSLVDGLYAHERFEGALTTEGNASNLKSNIYQGRLALQYEFQRWLRSSLSYIYTKRESNFPEYNFSSNTVDFHVTAAF